MNKSRFTRHSSIAVRGLPENGSSGRLANLPETVGPTRFQLSSKYDDSAYGCAISHGLKRLLRFFQPKDGRREPRRGWYTGCKATNDVAGIMGTVR